MAIKKGPYTKPNSPPKPLAKLGGPYKKPTSPPKGLQKRTALYTGNEPGPTKTVRRKGPVSGPAKR